MKKVLAFFSMIIMMTTLTQGVTVKAAQPTLTVEQGKLTVVELPRTQSDSKVSYTPYEYSQTFTFKMDGVVIATATAECEVWHYSDGKVHLYNRTISTIGTANYTSYRTYGSIVNTDGSLSYTTGDRVVIYDEAYTWRYAIDFRITPTTSGSFSCYGV
ncbi:MAG: hypothetical protein IKB07_00825 [Lachnospiraceae bacterium]|nr:hypothetical protein [Lachnospiraceae bacterium]